MRGLERASTGDVINLFHCHSKNQGRFMSWNHGVHPPMHQHTPHPSRQGAAENPNPAFTRASFQNPCMNLYAKYFFKRPGQLSPTKAACVSDNCSPAVLHTAHPAVNGAKVCAQLQAEVTAWGRTLDCWDNSSQAAAPRADPFPPLPWPFLPIVLPSPRSQWPTESHTLEACFLF